MRSSNNELTIQRGESFTLDRVILNPDNSPYLISGEMRNPYFLLTVASAVYDQLDRYVCNIWMPVTFPRFYETAPVDLSKFVDAEGNRLYTNFNNMTGLPSGYVNGVQITYEKSDAIFYFGDAETPVYKYYDDGWKDYECRLICKFTSQLTNTWIEREYLYNISLVDAPSMDIDQIEEMTPILPATKLSVLSNLKGGM